MSQEYQTAQSALESLILNRQRLETQLQENKIVMDEFKTLADDTPIYKLTGNVLLPVETDEAHSNVEKRLEFIQTEINRCEENIKQKQSELDVLRQKLLQQQQQQQQQQ